MIQMPGSWYDATRRVEAALAVSCLVKDVVPFKQGDYDRANQVVNLAVAVEELLTLAKKDIEQIESDMKGAST